MDSLRPLAKTKTDAAYEAIRNAILDGRIVEGTPLRQERVAVAHGMSPTPVREAFRRLEAEGLVRRAPHRGVIVHLAQTNDDFGDLTRMWQRLCTSPAAVPGSDFP